VLFVNAVQVFYSIFLSMIGNKFEPTSTEVQVTGKGIDIVPTLTASGSSSDIKLNGSTSSSEYYDETRELSNEDDEQYM